MIVQKEKVEKRVAICICTRKRPLGIITVLQSLKDMAVPSDVLVDVIVVENDEEENTRSKIEEFTTKSSLPVKYFLEPNLGISHARNRSVREAGKVDFCCFVDDDQKVDMNWLSELLKCQEEFGSEGVFGVNPPLFGEKVPAHIDFFHQPKPLPYGEPVEQAYTNCLLLKKEVLDTYDEPFDVRLNFTGGEDVSLSKSIIDKGGRILSNPKAIAYEIVPETRMTEKYIIKRTYKMANTKFYVRSLREPGFKKKSIIFSLTTTFISGCFLTIPYYLFSSKKKMNGLIKLSFAVGGFGFILGKTNKFYKH